MGPATVLTFEEGWFEIKKRRRMSVVGILSLTWSPNETMYRG